jgi:hypothetical protein
MARHANPKWGHDEFRRRYLLQFIDPAFDRIRENLDAVAEIAWKAYSDGRKAHTRLFRF